MSATTGYVVDASVVVKWLVDEEGSDAAAELAGESLAAPTLLLAECANVLWVKARVGELDREQAKERTALLVDLPVTLEPIASLIADASDLALRLDVTVYDALYVALARRRGDLLITADHKLARAVRRSQDGVELRLLGEG